VKKSETGTRKSERKHREALYAKIVRLDGLRALYATHEQMGQVPLPRNYMWILRIKIRSVENQLKAMADSDEFLFP
jgi:hypothetical protein